MRSSVLYPAVVLTVLSQGLAGAISLPQPRIGTHPGFTRAVLDMPAGAAYRAEPLGAALRITLANQAVDAAVVKVGKPELSGFVSEQRGSDAVITLATPQGVSARRGYRINVWPAADGTPVDRLVLDFSGAFSDVTPLPSVPPFQFRNVQAQDQTVVLDPGHGGSDPGALGAVVEKEVTLDVARRAATALRAAGVRVEMTRDGDTALHPNKTTDLAARARLATGRSLFVSIHANATANTAYGIEVYYSGPQGGKPLYPVAALPPAASAPLIAVPTTPEAVPLEAAFDTEDPVTENPTAEGELSLVEPEPLLPVPSAPPVVAPPAPLAADRLTLSRQAASRVLSQLLGSTGALSRGVRTAPFYVIKYSPVPAILVEMGFVSHPVEGGNLKDSNYRDRIAYGIARGVLEYLDSDQVANAAGDAAPF
jgi:N-acetylmuramoyl-L-alanine amidase